jgi:excisionase family DNA binding protein
MGHAYVTCDFDAQSAGQAWPMNEPWVGAQEIADHLGVSRYTVRVWAKTDKIPGVRIGRDWKFKISVVDEHLSQPKPWGQSDQSRARVAYYKRKRRGQPLG